MRLAATARLLPLLTCAAVSAHAERLTLRGQEQTLHVYGQRGGPPALVASGDGGWVHLGPEVAEFLAGKGYFVVGLDSKAYLASFTHGTTTLTVQDVPSDFAALLAYTGQGSKTPPLVVGVSEGAALAVLAAAQDAVRSKALGVIGLGLPDQAELGWRFRDSVIYVTKGVPREPLFSTAEVIAGVAPLPLVAIHSTKDEFVPADEVTRVMSRAREPKKLVFLEAENHRFSGREQDLYQKILEAIAWIQGQRR